MKKVLVLTASFGDGHNAAAKGIREALEARGDANGVVVDLYARAVPLLDRSLQFGYSLAINRFPWIWDLIFRALDQPGLLERMIWTMGALERAMEKELREHEPTVVISTYPLYAYLFRKIQRRGLGVRTPFVTVITDSVEVNSAWYRCRSDAFVVADDETARVVTGNGVDPVIVHSLGFPVSRRFAVVEPLPESAGKPWKLLFMPSTQLVRTTRQVTSLLQLPDVELTVLTGRHERLQRALMHSGLGADRRVKILGWTDEMPALLSTHHVFIGKAGGAIVQEAIAARCPFLVSHVVPGQEEGSIALIERMDVGARAVGGADELARRVEAAVADDAAGWRRWKRNLAAARKPMAADEIAEFALRLGGDAGVS
jgi:processive 1,2-diacylglycerol beta-glucosyltransferase